MPLRIFEPKEEEETSASIKLHNDERVICAHQNISLGRSSKDFVTDGVCVSCWAAKGRIQDFGGHTRRKEIIWKIYTWICEKYQYVEKKREIHPSTGLVGPKGSRRPRIPYFKIIGTRRW